MAQQYDVTPVFPLGPLNHRGRDVDRPSYFSIDQKNIDYLEGTDDAVCRLGEKLVGDNAIGNTGGFGTWLYNKYTSTGAISKEIIIAGSQLFRVKVGTLTITYVGAGSSVTCSHLVDTTTNKWTFELKVDGTVVISIDNNVGFDHASINTIANVQATVDAHADFTASFNVSVTAVPAAIAIPIFYEEPFVSGAFAINYYFNELVQQPAGSANPFAGSLTNKNNSDFELITSIEKFGVRYFVNGYDEMKKYDSVTIYRAGMPKGALTSVTSAAGSVGTGSWPDVYQHMVTYIQKDAVGNIVEGEMSPIKTTTISALSNFTLTIPNILNTSGFNTNCAVVNGTQTGVTIFTVDDGAGGNQTLQVGEIAYFYDGVTAGYVERTVTARTNSTITISGAPVNVTDNDVVSSNLRIAIYRTVADGSIFKLVREIPNNSFTASQSYVDSTVDGSLGADYSDPESLGVEHGLPPKFKYFATYGNILVGCGSIATPRTIYFSDIDSPEYWPVRNSFIIEGGQNTPYTGIVENGPFVFVFRSDETWAIAGDLTQGAIQARRISSGIGCDAHASIVRYDNFVLWVASDGIFFSDNGGPPIELSAPIKKFFRKSQISSTLEFKFKRAIGIDDPNKNKVIFFIPCETTTAGEVAANTNSQLFVYDFYRQGWLIWDTWNWAGGVFRDGEDLFWVARRYSDFSSALKFELHQRLNKGTIYDYADHQNAINGKWLSSWEFLGKPGVPKDFHALRVYSNNPFVAANYSLTAKTFINFVTGNAHTVGTLEFGQSNGSGSDGWGLGAWGDAAWGDPIEDHIKTLELMADSVNAIQQQFEFTNIYNFVVLSGYQYEFSAPYKPHFDRLT
jgi:hypothetical protein